MFLVSKDTEYHIVFQVGNNSQPDKYLLD